MLNIRIFLQKYRRMCYTISGKNYAAGAVRNGQDMAGGVLYAEKFNYNNRTAVWKRRT